jgi:alpha-tubulin suppressor-like RCC1 family protein
MTSTSQRFSRFLTICTASLVLASTGCRDDDDSAVGPERTAGVDASAATTTTSLVFIQISGGGGHSCGITSDNKAYCWGANGSGELGTGSRDENDHLRPLLVSGGLSFRQVKAGLGFTCGVTLADRAYCWGFNGQGQLGDGTKINRFAPVPVAGGRSFHRISAGEFHACALTSGGAAFCWGENASGKLGDGTTTDRLTPVRVKSGGRLFGQVVAGWTHTCALGTDALGYCWGANFSGQLGDGTTTDRTVPVAIRGGRSLKQITAGERHSCAVTTGNAAYCWGYNQYGQIGDGTATFAGHRLHPVAVLGGLSFTAVFAGGFHTCGLTTTKLAYCWGYNAFGQLGDGTVTRRTTPVAVTGGRHFSGLSAGFSHTCAVTTDERAFCWGSNDSGRLGDGTAEVQRLVPAAVVGPS